MKKLFLFFIVLLPFCFVSGQTVISNGIITSGGFISLGNKVQVQFSVNQQRLCDSYLVSTSTNYTSKTVTIEVNYNYNGFCDPSISSFFELVEEQIVLEGVFSVVLELKAPSNSLLNQTIQLGTVLVNPPPNNGCGSAFVPSFFGFCPTNINTVCACNGVTYPNECKAYLESKQGNYQSQSCDLILWNSAKPYFCGNYFTDEINFFEKYDCSAELYDGRESYFRYEVSNQTDSIVFNFSSQAQQAILMFSRINIENIECLASTNQSRLVLYDIPVGTYYLIVDSKTSSNTSFELCEGFTNTENLHTLGIQVYPNPCQSSFFVDDKHNIIEELELFNAMGERVLTRKNNQNKAQIDHYLPKGCYLLRIKTSNGQFGTERIVVY